MTATERLRQLLDERGVEWHGTGSVYGDDFDATESVWKDDALDVTLYGVSPEQAVEATLGRGTCKMKRVEDEQRILHGWLECSECGPVYPPVNDGIAKAVAFCPFCGRKVVE